MDFHREKTCLFLILEARILLRKNGHRLGEAWCDNAIVWSTAAVWMEGYQPKMKPSLREK